MDQGEPESVREGHPECRVLVVGSANMDLVFGCPRLPAPGETLMGQSFESVPGGKGANQAAAIARLGGLVSLVCKVGDDRNGQALFESLRSSGVDLSRAGTALGVPTGVAGIFVDARAQNSIVVVPGANSELTAQEVRDAISESKPQVVLVQLEVAISAVQACSAAPFLVLNPAPYAELPDALYSEIDVITPNETELEAMTGICPSGPAECDRACRVVQERGVDTVVITLGARGCYVASGARQSLIEAPVVAAIDTTAAGDAFSGALAHFMSEGRDVWNAAALANHVAALSTTRAGAQDSMPNLAELRSFAPHLL